MTKSSPSGTPPARSASRLKGTPITHRKPVMAGWKRDRVTVPITSAMRMAVQLLEGASQSGRASRSAGGAAGAEDLPNLEKGPARHFDGEQVRSQRQRGPGGLGDRAHGHRPQAGCLVGHAADQAGILT